MADPGPSRPGRNGRSIGSRSVGARSTGKAGSKDRDVAKKTGVKFCGHPCANGNPSVPCCVCADRRAGDAATRYLQYVDGEGDRLGLSRSAHYCPVCKPSEKVNFAWTRSVIEEFRAFNPWDPMKHLGGGSSAEEREFRGWAQCAELFVFTELLNEAAEEGMREPTCVCMTGPGYTWKVKKIHRRHREYEERQEERQRRLLEQAQWQAIPERVVITDDDGWDYAVPDSPRAMGNLGAFFGAGATSTAFGNFADTPLYSDSQEYAPTSVMSVTTDGAAEMFGDQLAEERAMERVLDGDMSEAVHLSEDAQIEIMSLADYAEAICVCEEMHKYAYVVSELPIELRLSVAALASGRAMDEHPVDAELEYVHREQVSKFYRDTNVLATCTLAVRLVENAYGRIEDTLSDYSRKGSDRRTAMLITLRRLRSRLMAGIAAEKLKARLDVDARDRLFRKLAKKGQVEAIFDAEMEKILAPRRPGGLLLQRRQR